MTIAMVAERSATRTLISLSGGPRNGPQTPCARTRPGGAGARLGVDTRCVIGRSGERDVGPALVLAAVRVDEGHGDGPRRRRLQLQRERGSSAHATRGGEL